uniref:THAP domain containing protein n=1 Tax=Rhipicephalus zambeziensis TaxID=60191 RepID=A0A224Z9P4_9ACAR
MTKARLRHCYAPGCRTGYAGVKAERKLSLFSVPKDESSRKIWERNLHRSDKALEENCAVCELHFEDRYILLDYVHIIDGKEVRIARGVPALTPDAVPTILPNAPKYLSTKLPPKRAPRKREAPTVTGPQNSKKACTNTPVDEDFESQDDVHDVSTVSLKLENF